MSIENTFDEYSEGTISVEKVYKKSKKFKFDFMIITFSKRLIDELIARKEIVNTRNSLKSVNGNTIIYYLKNNPNIGIYMTIIGAPLSVALMEETSHIFRCKNYIMFGTCGTLNKELTYGKFVIPNSAYRDEGTSYHYKKSSDFIDVIKASELIEFFTKEKENFVVGKTWTTDSFYRETVNNVAKRKAKGCIVVEMEVSAFEAAAEFYKINFYPFLMSGDIVIKEWEPSQLKDLNHDKKFLYYVFSLAKRFILSKI